MMITIGGAIGTGLFLASDKTISQTSPGGAIVVYGLIGPTMFLLMQSLGEMSTYSPVAGSFGEYGTRFISPSFGFTAGQNFWFNWAIAVTAELTAVAFVMKSWFPHTPGWTRSAIFLTLLVLLNALPTRAYGEGEFWFALIKVVTVVVFLVLGVFIIFGIIGGKSSDFENQTKGEAPFVDGGLGILAILMVAGFSFQGTELVAIIAGETEDPEQTVPKAIRTIFWRILLFYIGTIAVIGFLASYTDPSLLCNGETDVAYSPFTPVFDRAGIAAAASVINAITLTSILSAGDSGLYASTRILYALSRQGNAPAFPGRTNSRGAPVLALAVTAAIDAACFVSSLIGDGAAYMWLVGASGLAGFITWMGIAWSHYEFRKAFLAQGHSLNELPYRVKWYPAGPLLAMAMCTIVIVGQSYEAFDAKEGLDVTTLLSSYIGLPLLPEVWVFHKIATRSPKVKSVDADLSRTPNDVRGSEEALSG